MIQKGRKVQLGVLQQKKINGVKISCNSAFIKRFNITGIKNL